MAIRDSLRDSLDQLVRAHYVERCPKPEPFISATLEDETSTARKRGSKVCAMCSILVFRNVLNHIHGKLSVQYISSSDVNVLYMFRIQQ